MVKIIVISLALALDCFAVSLGLGCGRKLNLKERLSIIFYFASFQTAFALLGAGIGRFINSNLFTLGDGISGLIIVVIGLLFIRDGYKKKDQAEFCALNFTLYILLAISVSIDALAVGFSVLYNYSLDLVLINALIIGLVSALLTISSFYIAAYIKNFTIVEKYAEYIGGSILIIFGLQMMI